MDHAVAAYLTGDTRLAASDFERARSEIARTGRIDLLGRAELVRCAARVASLVFEPCEGFEKLRADSAAPERAYADYLAARVQPQDIALLPEQHRAVAAASISADNAVGRAARNRGSAIQTGRDRRVVSSRSRQSRQRSRSPLTPHRRRVGVVRCWRG